MVESAVYIGNPKHYQHSLLKKALGNVFLLREDVIARGITDIVSFRIGLISFDGFVKLTEKHSKAITW
ncbi:tusB protein [Candidatus Photodesmus katoptron]|nr:tusB protein [Candidatus Photodesmus katoptron]